MLAAPPRRSSVVVQEGHPRAGVGDESGLCGIRDPEEHLLELGDALALLAMCLGVDLPSMFQAGRPPLSTGVQEEGAGRFGTQDEIPRPAAAS